MNRIQCFFIEPLEAMWNFHMTDGTYRIGGQDLHDAGGWTKAHPLYRNPATGEENVRHDMVGAMFYCDWLEGMPPEDQAAMGIYPGPDGRVLGVMTPGGQWIIDQTANNGPKDRAGWTRTGSPPNVTAHPSILQGDRYHGWLKDGWLEEC